MPQKIIEFRSLDEATITLENFASAFIFPVKNLNRDRIIKESVASNIFRAFRNLKHKPSNIYRDWANENFEAILIDFEKVYSHEDYYSFAFKYADSLINRWSSITLKSEHFLIYGPALKMINLFIKTTQQSSQYKKDEKTRYQQVPFDSFSLQPLRFIINDLTGLNYKVTIPINASMGFINTQQIYKIMTESVLNLCRKINIPPIVYDYWCWEDKHK
jgi:hypothetical protein